MATIITRETGETAKNSPLTNAEVDQNFINLNEEVAQASSDIDTLQSNALTADKLAAISGAATPSAANVFATAGDIINLPTANQKAALDASHDPGAMNAYATIEDIATSNAAGSAGILYFGGTLGAQGNGFHILEPEPTTQATAHFADLPSTNVAVELDRYATEALGLTRISAGNWTFDLWTYVSTATGVVLLEAQPVKVASNGTFTNIGSAVRTPEINHTVYSVMQLTVALPAQTILETDAIGCIISGVKTSNGGTPRIYFSHDLTAGRLSVLTTPLTTPRPASLTEVQAGTEVALRTFSPLRVWQAIATWFLSVVDTDLSSVSANNDTVPSAKATKTALDTKLDRIEGLVETATAYNSSSLSSSGLTLDCTAALTVTLETYTNRGEGFQFAVISSGGDVTFAGTYDKKSTFTKCAQGDTAWVIRKSGTWHVSGLSS